MTYILKFISKFNSKPTLDHAQKHFARALVTADAVVAAEEAEMGRHEAAVERLYDRIDKVSDKKDAAEDRRDVAKERYRVWMGLSA